MREEIADKVRLPTTMEDKRHWQLSIADDVISYLKTLAKRTTIGPERSMPEGTEIYFFWKDELDN
ncbi:hypothetical protein ES703_76357 [subsurface metagenome]